MLGYNGCTNDIYLCLSIGCKDKKSAKIIKSQHLAQTEVSIPVKPERVDLIIIQCLLTQAGSDVYMYNLSIGPIDVKHADCSDTYCGVNVYVALSSIFTIFFYFKYF